MSTYHCHSLSMWWFSKSCSSKVAKLYIWVRYCSFSMYVKDERFRFFNRHTSASCQLRYRSWLTMKYWVDDWDPTCLNSNMLFWIATICTKWINLGHIVWQFQDLIHVAPLNCKWYKTNPVLFQKKIIDLLLEFNPRTKTCCWWRFGRSWEVSCQQKKRHCCQQTGVQAVEWSSKSESCGFFGN